MRVIFLKNPILFIVMIMIAGIVWIRNDNKIQEITPNKEFLTIFPDTVKINGDLMSGETSIDKQKVKFFYRIRSQAEKSNWKSLSEPVTARVTIDKIEKIKLNRNPGEFNYKNFLKNRNIYYSVRLAKVTQIKNYQPKSLSERINVLRIHGLKKLEILPKWIKIHTQSLLFGYSSGEEKEFFNSLSILGIIHLFSLSGLHVLMLVTFFRKSFSTIKITRELTDDILLILLPVYGIMVGSKIGIWRAIVLSILGIIISKLKWNISKLDVFSLTIIICLIVQPKSILDMGGQLSFLLSFALLFIYDIKSTIGMTFKINLVSLPLICNYTYQFSWLILLTNLIFVPFFEYIILPTTVIAVAVPDLSIWNIVNQLFDNIYKFLEQIAQDDRFILITGKISLLVVLILIGLSLFNLEQKKFQNKYLFSYIVIFTLAVTYNKFPLAGQVSMIDVGQGDSILVTTPFNRKTILIDTGGKLSFPKKEWQKGTISDQVTTSTIPYLKSLGINRIDRIFLSHKDADHMGNLPILLSKFPVSEVSFGEGLDDNISIKRIINNNSSVKFTHLKQGDKFKIADTGWNVLWPKKRSIGENGDSLTLLASINDKNWLFTGDLDIDSEKKILDDYKIKIDYLKVGHHGSRTSSGDEFLKQISPKLALISAGVNNRYGHPNKETIQRLDKLHVSHMNTADYGMITWYYYPFMQQNKIKTFLKGEVIENKRIKK
ncbi:DNA internalization-related competence protein ComEC/Rec2 [Companilactobacillus keshanensis]|uniref:DNA internalization-related competence protein ComEC/Rec2 n=2 Tax=Companilactobacillus keshanensis TaxID=2486003 RepID=A0ABW4BVM3_9LACO